MKIMILKRECLDDYNYYFNHKSLLICLQRPPCALEYERRRFCRDNHVRFHSSDPNSEIIKTYVWPALILDGICIHKGVVVT